MISALRRAFSKVSDGRGVLGGAVSSIFVRAAGALTTLIAMPIALHTLGQSRFGTFLLLFGIINWISLGNFGVHSALGRSIAAKEVADGELPTMLGGALVYSVITTVITAGAVWIGFLIWSSTVGVKFNVPMGEVTLAAEVMLLTVGLQIVLQVFEGVRIGNLKLYAVNFARLAGSAFSFAGLIVLPRFWPSIVVFVIALNGGLLVGSLLNAGLVLREVRPRFNMLWAQFGKLQHLAGSGLAYFVIGIASLFQTHLPVLILASLQGPVAGIDYGLFIRLLFVMMTGLGMFTSPLWPALLRARNEADWTWVQKSLRRAAYLVIGAGGACCAAIALFGDPIVYHWTGRHIVEPGIFQVLFGIYFLQMAWSHYWATLLMGCGQERTVSLVIIVEAVLMMVAGSVLAAYHGPVGMIMGQVFGFAVVSNWLLPLFARREFSKIRSHSDELPLSQPANSEAAYNAEAPLCEPDNTVQPSPKPVTRGRRWRILYGLSLYLYGLTGWIPSQHVRRWFYKAAGMKIGANSAIYMGAEVRSPRRIVIGEYSSIGSRAVMDGRGNLTIGDRVNMSSEVMLWTMQHDYRAKDFPAYGMAIVIENYVWLGPRVIVLPGVTVAEGCVIAAGAVVTRSTAPYGIYAGIPAKRIGERPRDLDYRPGENYTPFV